jgi:arginine-tRNA-protein transferase
MKRWLSAPYQNFYRTAAQPCPYIDGRSERKIITELSGPLAIPVYNELSRAGFRRSHSLAYRPACELCSACLPARIVADAFEPGRSARRLARINADLTIEAGHSLATEEQYSLFSRYQQARHGDSDMAGMNFIEYRAMIEDSGLSRRPPG